MIAERVKRSLFFALAATAVASGLTYLLSGRDVIVFAVMCFIAMAAIGYWILFRRL